MPNFESNRRPKPFFKGYRWWLLAIVGLHLIIRMGLSGGDFDDNVINGHAPSASDAFEYTQRAQALVSRPTGQPVFEDARRMPGYPAFLALFTLGGEPRWHLVRIVQWLLTASLILISASTLRRLGGSRKAALLAALFTAAWPPLHWFAPVLFPESLSLFFLGLLVWVLAGSGARSGRLASVSALAALLAILVYLKPNQILILPALIFTLSRSSRSPSFRSAGLLVGMLVLLLLPWSLHASRIHSTPVLLTTTLGENLWLGSGPGALTQDGSSDGTLMQRVALARGLPGGSRRNAEFPRPSGPGAAVEDRIWARRAIDLWIARPVDTCIYGLAKLAHAFGGSLRDLRDVAQLLLLFTALGASLRIRRARSPRPLLLLFWSLTVLAALQAFVLLPDQRFKTVLFDLPALLVIVLGICPGPTRGSHWTGPAPCRKV